ncbi:hypothetical protein [Anabaena sp. CCY 9402-a]
MVIPTREYPLTLRYHRPHSLINLAVDSGRRSIRHHPAIHPTLHFPAER